MKCTNNSPKGWEKEGGKVEQSGCEIRCQSLYGEWEIQVQYSSLRIKGGKREKSTECTRTVTAFYALELEEEAPSLVKS